MARAEPPAIVIRADAGPSIGAGHVMRGMALGQAWMRAGGKVVLATASPEQGLRHRLGREGFDVVALTAPFPDPADADGLDSLLRRHAGAWVAVDGYAFDETYHRRIREAGHPLLVIDDTAHLRQYHADVLLNQNAHARLLSYSTDPETRRLLGPSYVLLRHEFLQRPVEPRAVPETASKILVTLGGADPEHASGLVARALGHLRFPTVEVVLVCGPHAPHEEEPSQRGRHHGVHIRTVGPVEDMRALMSTADLAITSGGTSVWELAYLGVPALVLETRPQEELLVRGLREVGLFASLGHVRNITEDQIAAAVEKAVTDRPWRSRMAELGRKTVDGRGCDRVLAALRGGGTVRDA